MAEHIVWLGVAVALALVIGEGVALAEWDRMAAAWRRRRGGGRHGRR